MSLHRERTYLNVLIQLDRIVAAAVIKGKVEINTSTGIVSLRHSAITMTSTLTQRVESTKHNSSQGSQCAGQLTGLLKV